MISRTAFRRPPSLPTGLQPKRRTPAPTANDAPSPTVLVSQVVVGALLVFMWLALVALVPMTALALFGLAGVSALLAYTGRRRASRQSERRPASRSGPRPAVWRGTVAVSSVALLVIALFVPDGYDAALAVLGVMGLMALRIGAKPGYLIVDDDAAVTDPAVAPLSDGDDVAHTVPGRHPVDASRSKSTPYELGRARFSASDRPTPRTWRRRERVKYPMHAIG